MEFDKLDTVFATFQLCVTFTTTVKIPIKGVEASKRAGGWTNFLIKNSNCTFHSLSCMKCAYTAVNNCHVEIIQSSGFVGRA